MFDNQRVNLLLDGLKSKHFIGLKSNIMCHPTLRNDFNATASHIKDMVNRLPEIHTVPGLQVSAMGRGGDMAVALVTVDVRAAPDVTDVMAADLIVVADTEAVEMTMADIVTASQAQPPPDLKTSLTKTPLTA